MTSEYIIGRNPVIEALRSGRDINKIWIAEGRQRTSTNCTSVSERK